ncbi:MAG: ABC transporter ATP-binding protein/permease [Myxococcales bacterium]|nr:ABC transporter ATP-binding protein/permease [Myxococcales bacterium]
MSESSTAECDPKPAERTQASESQRAGAGESVAPVQAGTEAGLDLRLAKRLWPHLRPHGGLMFVSLLTIPLTSLATLAQPYLVKRTIDSVLVEHDDALWSFLIIAYAGAVLFEFLLRFVQNYTMQLAGQRAMADLRRRVFGHAQRMRVSYFDRTPIGRVLTRITNDVDSLGELFSSGAVMAVADIVMLVGIVAVMLSLDWKLSLVIFAVLPPLAAAVEIIRRYAREAYRDIRTRIAELNAYLSEQVQGMQVVQAFGREQPAAEHYREINDAYRRANHRSIKLDATLYSVVEAVSASCMAIVLWFAGVRVGLLKDSTAAMAYVGTVVAFYQYIQQFFVPIRDLSTKYTLIQSAFASAERVFGFLDVDELEGDGGGGRDGVFIDRAQASIELSGVSFGYRPDTPVVRDFDLVIAPGENVAIVGATGAGKSTLIALLLRLYETDQGSIRIAGRDLRELSLRDLRGAFSLVQQDVFLLAGSVAENVALSSDWDEARVRKALERVGGLGLVEARPGGLRAKVDERGANFSAGERQLIAFARALYRDAPFLILDEATANVDSETEARLQAAVAEVLRERTALVVAHRLSTIRRADRILVLHKGRIAEQGTHEELLERGEIYAKLHRLQFGEGGVLPT